MKLKGLFSLSSSTLLLIFLIQARQHGCSLAFVHFTALLSSFSHQQHPLQRCQEAVVARLGAAASGPSGGRGFGGSSSSDGNDGSGGRKKKKNKKQVQQQQQKTYGNAEAANPIRDMIDSEAAMRDFFTSREEWIPLFKAMAVDGNCAAREHLGDGISEAVIDFDDDEGPSSSSSSSSSSPWKRLPAIPERDDDKQILAGFLDAMHQSLVNIPVDESVQDDENDLHFVEEGRRMLAISRFHVLKQQQQQQQQEEEKEKEEGADNNRIQGYDALFTTCWSELHALSSSSGTAGGGSASGIDSSESRCEDEGATGSLIVLPDYDLQDLRRFVDLNVHRPLEWLGLSEDFEVVSMVRGSPAVRLLYKLGDIPTDSEIAAREVE